MNRLKLIKLNPLMMKIGEKEKLLIQGLLVGMREILSSLLRSGYDDTENTAREVEGKRNSRGSH